MSIAHSPLDKRAFGYSLMQCIRVHFTKFCLQACSLAALGLTHQPAYNGPLGEQKFHLRSLHLLWQVWLQIQGWFNLWNGTIHSTFKLACFLALWSEVNENICLQRRRSSSFLDIDIDTSEPFSSCSFVFSCSCSVLFSCSVVNRKAASSFEQWDGSRWRDTGQRG